MSSINSIQSSAATDAYMQASQQVKNSSQQDSDTTSDSPAAIVELSADAIAGRESIPSNYSVQATIKSTIDIVGEMHDKTLRMLAHYNDYTDDDKGIVASDDRKALNRLWGPNSPSQAGVDEWRQHGLLEDGKKVIKNGSANLQKKMTALFNMDLDFYTYDKAKKSYKIIDDAYNAMLAEL